MFAVAVIDPLLVLEPERLAAASAAAAQGGGGSANVPPFVKISVPFRLLAQLHQGRLELADHDDPGNHWYFGKQAELFQYQFMGRHAVTSGFTSLIQAHELQELQSAPPPRQNRKQAALEERSWLAFLQRMQGSSGEGLWPTPSLPFLFAGKAIDCASVGVYTAVEGGVVQGLMLATEYETPGAD
ncbi:hypothetical protein CHLNCDRAFT_138055 [Chlorella variabilis]|uniref:Uncharacterized protein n=1 Tax=Chlorella variabilis TaxID=554065 RepID=E1Z555_CHLVA|nr:hypothetical protein CHLNCDRAFT_138055 [Chlorella variabilis]EFN59465.1 hypothetical protein CHLNCDRAFT_138055 [Chlorella variabilis]|eukprot:XP_005851567.1 hypothetical protein CHLNCDRAFT_138055 [Chlorella variabilis]